MIWAVVRTTFKGVHHWPDAPKGDYHYLKHPHRHVFHVTLKVEQLHENRDVEYLELKDWLDMEIRTGHLQHRSCEMIAEDIKQLVQRRFGDRAIQVEVSEDGENGALVT